MSKNPKFRVVIASIIIGTMISACNDDDGAGSPVVDLIKSQSEKNSQKIVDLQVQLVKLSEQLEKLQAVVVDNSKADEAYKELVELIKNQSTKDSQKRAELQVQLVKLSEQLEKLQAVVITFVAGKVFQDRLKVGGFAPEMVVIPAGSFRMGDIQGGGRSNEQPVHEVSVDRFAMGKYEVTFAEYDKFAEATGREKPSDSGWGRGNRPVINVSWNDATAYTKWLSDQTGKEYRLPTEAEWEYVARAGTETKYWWGNDIGRNKANCNSACGDGFKYTSPVGSFSANKFGLYDTSGNVWEWTCSEFTEKYNDKEKQCVTTVNRLSIRGGSWNGDARLVRSAFRSWYTATNRTSSVGFRVSMLVTL